MLSKVSFYLFRVMLHFLVNNLNPGGVISLLIMIFCMEIVFKKTYFYLFYDIEILQREQSIPKTLKMGKY